VGQKGTVYFFTGLAGAGKTTIGGLFYERLKQLKPDAVLMDGDKIRARNSCSSECDAEIDENRYTTEYRKGGARGMFRECRDIAEQGMDVVICSISMYSEIREWNRENIENYKEIYIRTKWETLLARNQKGLYSPGRKNVVGVDLPYDEPENPDVIIQNDGWETPEKIVDRLENIFGLSEKKYYRTETAIYESGFAYAQHRI